MTKRTLTANGVFYEFNESGSVHILNPQTLKRYRYEKERFRKGLQTWGKTLDNVQKHVNLQEAYFEEYNETEAAFTDDEQAMETLRDFFGAAVEWRVCRVYSLNQPAKDRKTLLREMGLREALISPKGLHVEAFFRNMASGETAAFFPNENACFLHIGQLMRCGEDFARQARNDLARPNPEQVAELMNELAAFGYVVTDTEAAPEQPTSPNPEQASSTPQEQPAGTPETFTLASEMHLCGGEEYGGEIYFLENTQGEAVGTLAAWLVGTEYGQTKGRAFEALRNRKGEKVVLSPFAGKRGTLEGCKITLKP